MSITNTNPKKKRNKKKRFSRGFTLLEIMISLAILSISLLALYNAIGNSLRASGMAEDMDQAMQLARQKMAEVTISLEADIARGAFPDEKEEQGEFDKPFERYKWSYVFRKVELPAVNPTNLLQGQGEEAGGGSTPSPSGTQTTAGIEQQAGNLAQVVSKKISESIRELRLTVTWGEGEKEEDQEKVVLTTHLAKLR
jgi:general secretion pathway protein I